MTMRILADENLDRPIVNLLRDQGHDVVEITATAPGSSDPELVEYSRSEGRVLITFGRDIGRIVLAQSKPHPGVIYLRLRRAGQDMWNRFKQLWPPSSRTHLATSLRSATTASAAAHCRARSAVGEGRGSLRRRTLPRSITGRVAPGHRLTSRGGSTVLGEHFQAAATA